MGINAEIPFFTLDLPKPPSVNRFIGKLGNKSPQVRQWIRQADAYLMARKPYPHIQCEYELTVEFNETDFSKWDLDNRIKALSDWMQRVEIISNDKYCRQIVLR